ncbi:gliding motility-associated C-terminal domain-containing protein [Membranicola marinus]|uniref:Gliding motility-associated C-terminal domain-containing protein n=1 Tax=Membranihabitans marinus TaxID=1227546 RepID=A0A953LAU8_9BACT|nr:T9SS type B sorting domain-containing protein [Membranihabitans marinus]MBY5959053.1 gliding motility-associated C-terminal domain-containing protein [Membranihabitans marinus]
MRINFIFLILLLAASSWAQDITWSSNRPQNTLIEDCGQGEFILTNEGSTAADLSISLDGNYDDDDLSTDVLPNVTIQPGEAYSFVIEAVKDDQIESDEYVTITITSGNAILHEETLSLEDELFLEASAMQDFSACPGDELVLTASSNGNVTWMPGNVVSDTLLFSFQDNTEMTVTANQGSCMESANFTIESEVNVQINTADTLYLCEEDAPEIVTATLTNTNTVQWASQGFQFAQGAGNTIEINPVSSGWLYATVSAGSCVVTDTVYVQVDSLPEITFDTIPNKDPYCPGEIVTIYGMKLQQDRYPDVTYAWSPETGVISDVKKANLTVTTTDTITFVRTTTNNACISHDSVTLNVDNPPIQLNFTDTLICPNQTVEIELLNPERFESYEWGPEEKVSCTECVKTKATVQESSTITLNLKTEHCPTSASVNINVKPPNPITIQGDGPVCPGEDIQLTAVESEQYESFSWAGSVDFSCTDCPNPTIKSDEINSATLTAVDANGCLGTGNFVYSIHQVPAVSIGIEPLEVAQGETITASLLTDESEEFTDIVWEVNGDITDETTMKANLIMASEENMITVTARTEDGCPVMATITVNATPPSYTIPNAFTPNAQSNNIFRVITKGNITVNRMRIFSRWSQLIYTDESGEGWDGTQNGKKMPSDTYVYMIELTLPDGQKIEETSEVTLIN